MASESSSNPYDINGANFNSELYLQKLLKVKTYFCFLIFNLNYLYILLTFTQDYNLKQIMDHEADVVRDTQTLHSDMQTLVYENYNKFISATDTVRKVVFYLYFILCYCFIQFTYVIIKLKKN